MEICEGYRVQKRLEVVEDKIAKLDKCMEELVRGLFEICKMIDAVQDSSDSQDSSSDIVPLDVPSDEHTDDLPRDVEAECSNYVKACDVI